jgi:hypothetical protein
MFGFDVRFSLFFFGFGDRNFPLLVFMLFMSLVRSGPVLPTILQNPENICFVLVFLATT